MSIDSGWWIEGLKKIVVAKNKFIDAAMKWASSKLIEVVALDSDVPWWLLGLLSEQETYATHN